MASKKNEDIDGLNFEWYKKFNWKGVPFEDRITHSTELVAGYIKERNDIEKWIVQKKTFGVIRGIFGTGKSTLRFWTENLLQESKRADNIVVNSLYGIENLDAATFKEKLLSPVLPFYSIARITKKHAKANEKELAALMKKYLQNKHMYVLIDEVQDIPKDTLSTIRFLSSELELNLSILLCIPLNIYNQNIKDSLLDRDQLNILLSKMNYDEMKEMIRKRIEFYGGSDLKPFTEDILKKIYAKSGGRPRVILNLCNDYAFDLATHGKAEVKEIAIPDDEVKEVEQEVKVEETEKVAPDFQSRYAQLSDSDRRVAEIIAKQKYTSFDDIEKHTKLSKITIKVALRRLQGLDKEYMKKKSEAPLPLVIGEGSTRNRKYSVIETYKPYFGES